ncbi:MAG: hypothetical protein IPH20_10315 [Bacteroidales bacterium]|nr:hypothetical protein [Bacteroidales bacterium]
MLGLAGVQNPDFTFENVGNYNVELIIVNGNGCSDTTSTELTVNPKPTSAFSMTENYENTQGRVLFTNGSIGANAYEWNFGTGIQSFEIDPVVDFTNEGLYEISLVTSMNLVVLTPSAWNTTLCSKDCGYRMHFHRVTQMLLSDSSNR